MTSIVILLAVVFAFSYCVNKYRGVADPAREAFKPTAIIAGALAILGLIVYISLT